MKRPEVVNMTTVRELRELRVEDFRNVPLNPHEFLHMATLCEAYWRHDGDPSRPHAELTSGLCGDGFIDILRVLRYSNLCHIAAAALVRLIREWYPGQVDWVVGSDHAAAALSHSVAIHIGAQHDFTEKGPNGEQQWRRFTVRPGEVVLQVEELITTAKTLLAVRKGMRAAHLPAEFSFAPVSAVLVYQGKHFDQIIDGWPRVEGWPVLSFVQMNINTWTPQECPLCKAGSKRLRPKLHWRALTEP